MPDQRTLSGGRCGGCGRGRRGCRCWCGGWRGWRGGNPIERHFGRHRPIVHCRLLAGNGCRCGCFRQLVDYVGKRRRLWSGLQLGYRCRRMLLGRGLRRRWRSARPQDNSKDRHDADGHGSHLRVAIQRVPACRPGCRNRRGRGCARVILRVAEQAPHGPATVMEFRPSGSGPILNRQPIGGLPLSLPSEMYHFDSVPASFRVVPVWSG